MSTGRRTGTLGVRLLWTVALGLVALLCEAGAAVPAGATQGQELPGGTVPVEVTERVTGSVGLVRSAGVVGSGWVAAPGTVVTNEHVARTRTGDIFVDFSDGERVECYTAVADREMDLAVLKCPTERRSPVPMTAAPAAGTPAAAVGYPGGRGPTVTVGEFTGEQQTIRRAATIRFTAPIEPGSSGSPVVDGRGRVAAVATFGGGWGVPMSELEPLLQVAEQYPDTKAGAEWRLRLRRSAVAAAVALPVAFVVGRRTGRNHALRSALAWSVAAVAGALAATQVQFMLTGPAHFV